MGVNKVQYGSQVLMDISDATVTPDTLLAGESAYNAAGEKIAGSLDPMLKSEYGGSGPGIVAMADKANEANTANNANTAVNAQHAAAADTAVNASKLGGETLAQIVPSYTTGETAMPYTWIDGKTVYRKVVKYTTDVFNVTGETMQVLTKTNEMNQAKEFLPMTSACMLNPHGSFRLLNYNRPDLPNYEFGWRIDKADSGWTLAVSIGEFLLSDIGYFVFIFYYTK